MKLLYCIEGIYNSGGMERIIIEKANYFQSIGYEVYIVTTNNRKRNSFFPLNNNIRLFDLDINYDLAPLRIWNKIIYKKDCYKKHKRLLQDIITTIQPNIIISTFGDEINFFNSINLPSNTKKIGEIHFSYKYRILNSRDIFHKVWSKYTVWKWKRIIKKLDAFVCLTEEDSHNWNKIDNLHIIPNFIPSIQPNKAELNSKRIISLGRLSYQKGYDLLLNAWKIVENKFPDWQLEIYGEGPQKLQLLNLISSLNLTRVNIHNPIKDPYKKISESSIYVMSSRFEGLPMVLLESISCGVPFVSFNCPCGPVDLVKKYDCGLIVNNGDYNELAQGLINLIENRELLQTLGDNAYKAASDFLPKKILPLWLELFQNLNKFEKKENYQSIQ